MFNEPNGEGGSRPTIQSKKGIKVETRIEK